MWHTYFMTYLDRLYRTSPLCRNSLDHNEYHKHRRQLLKRRHVDGRRVSLDPSGRPSGRVLKNVARLDGPSSVETARVAAFTVERLVTK